MIVQKKNNMLIDGQLKWNKNSRKLECANGGDLDFTCKVEGGRTKTYYKCGEDEGHYIKQYDSLTRPTAISCVLSVKRVYSQTELSKCTLKLNSQTAKSLITVQKSQYCTKVMKNILKSLKRLKSY